MSTESLEHSRDTITYPSEKIFTIPEIKSDIYASMYDRISTLTLQKIQEWKNMPVNTDQILKNMIFVYFGSIIRMNPKSLGLPEKMMLPWWAKEWKDIPFFKTEDGISIQSIASGETKLVTTSIVLSKLKAYWEVMDLIFHTIKQQIWDTTQVKNIRFLDDDSEPFRMGFSAKKDNKLATYGKTYTSVLEVQYKNGDKKLINVLDDYRVITSPKTAKERTTLAKIQQERKELKDAMNREPLFWGSLSYEYVLVWWAVGVLAGMRIVKSIRYRMPNGIMAGLIPEKPIQWTREQVTGMIAKEMQASGFMHNSQTASWEDMMERSRRTIREKLPSMSVSEINSRTWLLIQASTWNDIQKNPEKYMSNTPYRDLMKKWMKWILSHWVLFPLDVLLASEVATYSNSSTVFSASSDLAAFYLWQKSLDVITKFVPGGTGRALKLLRFPAWIAATVYSNKLWKEALEGNKKKWQHMFQDGFGSMYTDWQSKTLNILWWWFVNFGLDQAQKDKKAWDQLYDVGTTPGVFRLFGKELFDMPEVTFFQHKINLATDPGDWLRGQPWRTIDDWNQQIANHLPHNTLQLVRSLVGRMERSIYPFTEIKMNELRVTKEELLMQTLNTLLSWGNDPSKWPIDVKGNILISVEKELKSWWKWESSMNKVTEVVYSQVPKLMIDNFFMEHYYPAQILFHQTHISIMVWELAKSISPRELQYIQSLQEKMQRNLPISEEWKWIKTPVLWTSSNKWIPSETNTFFQWLLNNTTEISAVLDINPNTKPIKTTVWEYFAYVLNFMLEQKRRKEFYNEVQKWNKKWVQWTI